MKKTNTENCSVPGRDGRIMGTLIALNWRGSVVIPMPVQIMVAVARQCLALAVRSRSGAYIKSGLVSQNVEKDGVNITVI